MWDITCVPTTPLRRFMLQEGGAPSPGGLHEFRGAPVLLGTCSAVQSVCFSPTGSQAATPRGLS